MGLLGVWVFGVSVGCLSVGWFGIRVGCLRGFGCRLGGLGSRLGSRLGVWVFRVSVGYLGVGLGVRGWFQFSDVRFSFALCK